jgi:tetratricopeptide (TPR) repeat protein
VLAHELLAGAPPYTATSVPELFQQIVEVPARPLPAVPAAVAEIVARALAKDPGARWPTMTALRDAIAGERRRLFAARVRRWPFVAAGALLVVGIGAGTWWWLAHRTPPPRPGDDHVQRALDEYDVFYNDKALSSLRAALAVAPEHPRANAYMILFGGASAADRATAISAAQRARPRTEEHTKDRALLETAIMLVERGPAAARAALVAVGAERDRELTFWIAELDYRAGDYTTARDEYRALLAEPAEQFRGRIYDHDSAVLLYLDEPAESLRIGKLYRDAFPGEADAVAVYATTLAAAGRLDEAVAAAEDAMRLAEGEDTLAGLAKVLALRGDRARAKELYRRSLDRAGAARRPLRRAALAFLMWLDGELDEARATVEPCLPGGIDATARERGACLFVAGVIDPVHGEERARELDTLAEARPTYGAPASLAALVRARTHFFGGACLVDPHRPDVATPPTEVDLAAYSAPLDFFAAYHIPFFSTWSACERAALFVARGDRARAAELLNQIASRAPGREWLLTNVSHLTDRPLGQP